MCKIEKKIMGGEESILAYFYILSFTAHELLKSNCFSEF